ADQARQINGLQEARQQMERLAQELAQQEAATAEIREQVAAHERELAAYEAQHQEVSARLERAQAEVLEVLQRLAQARNEVRRLEGEMAGARARLERLAAARDALERERAAAQAARSEALAAADEHARRLKERRTEAEQVQAALASAREALKEGRRAVDEARARLSEVRATLQALERLEESHEGYQPAVKAVLSAAPSLPGLLGTVAQLLVVPARVEVAIHVALGGALQYIVMADEQGVQRAIEYLKARRAGRATFLALETLRGRPWPSELAGVLTQPGVVGRAAELVEYEPRLRIVADHLLGRTLVVETLPRALELARALPANVRLVTLAGELVVPGGPVTGGSAPAETGGGLLARRRELRELAQRVQRGQEELERRERQAAELAARVEALEQQLSAIRTAAQADEVALAEKRQASQSLASSIERM